MKIFLRKKEDMFSLLNNVKIIINGQNGNQHQYKDFSTPLTLPMFQYIN